MILPSIVLSFFSEWPRALRRPAYPTSVCQRSLAQSTLPPWFTFLEGEPPGEPGNRTTEVFVYPSFCIVSCFPDFLIRPLLSGSVDLALRLDYGAQFQPFPQQ